MGPFFRTCFSAMSRLVVVHLCMILSLSMVTALWRLIIILKRISRASIYHTRWEHRPLYNNTNNTHTYTDARIHSCVGQGIGTAVKNSSEILIKVLKGIGHTNKYVFISVTNGLGKSLTYRTKIFLLLKRNSGREGTVLHVHWQIYWPWTVEPMQWEFWTPWVKKKRTLTIILPWCCLLHGGFLRSFLTLTLTMFLAKSDRLGAPWRPLEENESSIVHYQYQAHITCNKQA